MHFRFFLKFQILSFRNKNYNEGLVRDHFLKYIVQRVQQYYGFNYCKYCYWKGFPTLAKYRIGVIRQGRGFEKKPTRSACPRVGHLYYYGTLFWGAKILMWHFLLYDLKHMLKSPLMRPRYWNFFAEKINVEWVMAVLGCPCTTL